MPPIPRDLLPPLACQPCTNQPPPRRIVRDYEKYIARQLKRGTTRQELNISWLKKNELELKRQVNELRDSIRQNWTTTGQELGKEIRQFWQASRPASPSRAGGNLNQDAQQQQQQQQPRSSLQLPFHLDLPRAESPGGVVPDFAAGYVLGLIGGVRSWVRHLSLNTLTSFPSLHSPSSSLVHPSRRALTSLPLDR